MDTANHMERGTETILLTDDEPLVRNMVAALLTHQGYTVLQACNGPDALQVAQDRGQNDIDMLLTDVVMPSMDGIQLTTEFRRVFPQAKIILMSGFADESRLRDVLNQPNVEFIEKPFTPQDLARKIRELLDRSP